MTRDDIIQCAVDSQQLVKSCMRLPCNLMQSRTPTSIIGKLLHVTPVVRLNCSGHLPFSAPLAD